MKVNVIAIGVALLFAGIADYISLASARHASSIINLHKTEKEPVQPTAEYRDVSTAIWKVGDAGSMVEAKLEVLERKDDSSIGSKRLARLSVKNLVTGKVLYSKESDDTPMYMYVRDLNDDGFEELILNWSGGSASRLEILEVNVDNARDILYESYRVDAALIDLGGKGVVDVLITTAESGAGPFYTTRYVWRGGRYQAMGRVPYAKLRVTINRWFGQG
jgi:hypothetical protein